MMAVKKLKGVASKAAMLAMAGVLACTGIAVSTQSSVDTLAASYSGYTSDYSSKHEAIEAGYELNLRVAEEGMVLLKNENNALPVPTGQGMSGARVTVFGYAGAKPSGGSSGNGGDTSGGSVGNAGSVYKTLEAVGYQVNPYVKDYYNNAVNNELTSDYQIAQQKSFAGDLERLSTSYASYNDAAFIVLNVGDTDDAYDAEKNPDGIMNERQFNKAQYDLIDHVTDIGCFDRVIVLINKSYPVELDDIKNNPNVDAILLVGEAGTNGLASAGPVISGQVNPSGRLSDTYAVDQTKDPAWINFPTNNLGLFVDDEGNSVITNASGTNQAGFTDYEEGIYVGYRYWETRAADEATAGNEEWYDQNVSYTFGYGLSYTTFEWTVTPRTPAESTITDVNDVLKFDVTVKNTGDVAGKDVVQLYVNAPYKDGGIEKAENVLTDFAKTDLLQPQESQTVTVSAKVSDLASYDWSDANKNGIRGYEVENGEYNIRIMTSAHYGLSANDEQISYTVNGTDGTNTCIHVKYAETGYEIENQFEDMNAYASGYSTTLTDKDGKAYSTYAHPANEKGFDQPLSRASTHVSGELKGLQVPATAPVNYVTTEEELLKYAGQTIDDSEGQPWYVPESEMPEYMTEEERAADTDGKGDVQLYQLIGRSYDDPLWDELLDQLTLREMQELINWGGWNTGAIEYIGKPSTRDTDGPKGWTGSNRGGESGNMFCSEPMIAATFNTDLIFEIGKNLGDQGLWGSTDRTDGGDQESYNCWYAPGMNIHRGSFDGRYIEYFSEDPVLTGKAAAALSLGIRSKGGYLTMKHFALHNDGRTVRSGTSGASGLYAWVNEQALREVYLRGYQICANEGNANEAMVSFTRFGHTWAGASYALNTELLRNEWGCKGYLVTDIVNTVFEDMNQLIRAGGSLRLVRSGYTGAIQIVDEETGEVLDASKVTATQVTAMRNATKQMLWSVANSNAMQVPTGASVVYAAGETTLNANVGTAATFEVGTAEVGTKYAYADVTYAVTEGNLPVGMSLDSATGAITGTPTVAGVYYATVTASAEDYIPASVEYTFVVTAAAVAPDYTSILEAIDALEAKVDAIDTTVDLSSITAQLTAIKEAVDAIDIPEADLSAVNASISALETRIEALEASADTQPEEEGGCGGSIGGIATLSIVGVLAVGAAVCLIVRRSKKNEN